MPKDLAQIADFVGESDLERVPTVVDVLHHLGGFQIGPDQRARRARVECRQHVAAGLVQFADHGLGRAMEILYRRTFAQELRIVANAEIDPGLLSGGLLQDRNHDAHGSGQDRAADDDHVPSSLSFRASPICSQMRRM